LVKIVEFNPAGYYLSKCGMCCFGIRI